eukprot:3598644-Prymnesium_polylepis.2
MLIPDGDACGQRCVGERSQLSRPPAFAPIDRDVIVDFGCACQLEPALKLHGLAPLLVSELSMISNQHVGFGRFLQ